MSGKSKKQSDTKVDLNPVVAKFVGNFDRIIKHSQENQEKLRVFEKEIEYECGNDGRLVPLVKKLMILDYLIMHYTDGDCDLDLGIALGVGQIIGDCAQELQNAIRMAATGDLTGALY